MGRLFGIVSDEVFWVLETAEARASEVPEVNAEVWAVLVRASETPKMRASEMPSV